MVEEYAFGIGGQVVDKWTEDIADMAADIEGELVVREAVAVTDYTDMGRWAEE